MSIEIKLPEPTFSIKFGEFRSHYDDINGKGGVYFLYDVNDSLLYIGKSSNLYARVNQHINGHGRSAAFAKLIYRIDVILESNDLYRELYETYAINTLRPIYNASKVFNAKPSDKQFDIQTKIDELVTEREFMRHEIYRLAGKFGTDVYYDLEDDLTEEESENWAELAYLRREYRKLNENIVELRKEINGK